MKKKNNNKNSEKSESDINKAIDDYLNSTSEKERSYYASPLPKKFNPTTIKKPDNEVLIRNFYLYKGNKSIICLSLGCDRSQLNEWIKGDRRLNKAYNDSVAYATDHAMWKLHELIDGVPVQDYDFTGKPVVYKRPPDIKAIRTLLEKNGELKQNIKTEISGELEVKTITGMKID